LSMRRRLALRAMASWSLSPLEVVELKIDFVDLEGLRSIALKGNPHVSERLNR
jgi:hypothetical protein